MVTARPQADGADPSRSARALEYWIDIQDRIIAVNDAYIEDISAHDPTCADAAAHVHAALLGRVLWQVLPQAAEWYRPLVHLARTESRPIAFAFRCDTPTLRRLMEMRIVAREDGAVRFVSTLIGQQPRDAVRLLIDGLPRGSTLVRMCSWCKRVKAGVDWLEVELALSRLGVSEAEPMPAVTHGICVSCKEGLTEMVTTPGATLGIGLPDER